MKRLDFYVWREMFLPFLIGTVAVVLMFQANQLIYVLKEFELQGIPFAAIAKSILLKTPYFLNMTLPVGMSLAASLAFSRLTRESELTAMRACGTKILRVILPAAIFGLLVAVGNFLLVEKVMPQSEREFRRVATQIGILGALPTFRPNAVIYLKQYTASFGSVSRGPNDTLVMSKVVLLASPTPAQRVFVLAERGVYAEGVFHFIKPEVWTFTMAPGQDADVVPITTKDEIVVNEKITINDIFQMQPNNEEKTIQELRDEIAEGKRTRRDTTMAEVNLHTRYSVPAACLVFAVVAPIFSVWFARSGAFIGVFLSIILVMLYYNAFVISTQVIGRNGWLPPVFAAWLPNIIFVVLGVIAIRRLE